VLQNNKKQGVTMSKPSFDYESVIKIYNRDSGKTKFATQQNLFLPKPGQDFMVRILPGGDDITTNPDWFFEITARHRLVGEKVKNVGCLKIINDERCPVCNFVSRLYDSDVAENIAFASDIKRYTRFIFNVVVRGQEDKGVQVWNVGKKVRENILAGIQRLKTKDQDWDITNPQTGRDYNVIVESTGGKDPYPDYSKSSFDFTASPLAKSQDEIDAILSKRFDLRQYQPKVYSQEETEQLLIEYLKEIGQEELVNLVKVGNKASARTFTPKSSITDVVGAEATKPELQAKSEPIVEELEIEIPSNTPKKAQDKKEPSVTDRLAILTNQLQFEDSE
jgi:hypothetical protein